MEGAEGALVLVPSREPEPDCPARFAIPKLLLQRLAEDVLKGVEAPPTLDLSESLGCLALAQKVASVGPESGPRSR
jgi:hypothetical protein